MDAVLELAGVTVRRGEAVLLDGVDWTVEEDERWVVLGPNGAGKTTLLQVASAQIHPTAGVVGILGEVLGTVDVFELRPRIGLTSAALAERIPRDERVHDVVVSASYGVVGRWRERYDDARPRRAPRRCCAEVGAGAPRRPHLRHPERGGAQAGADRPRADDRPGAAAARRAGRRARPRRPRGPRVHAVGARAWTRTSPATVLVSHHVEEIPPGFTHALLLREGRVVAAGPLEQVLTEETALRDLRDAAAACARGRPVGRTASRPRQPCESLTSGVGCMATWLGAGQTGGSWLALAVALGVRRAVQPRPDPADAGGRRGRRRCRRPARAPPGSCRSLAAVGRVGRDARRWSGPTS